MAAGRGVHGAPLMSLIQEGAKSQEELIKNMSSTNMMKGVSTKPIENLRIRQRHGCSTTNIRSDLGK